MPFRNGSLRTAKSRQWAFGGEFSNGPYWLRSLRGRSGKMFGKRQMCVSQDCWDFTEGKSYRRNQLMIAEVIRLLCLCKAESTTNEQTEPKQSREPGGDWEGPKSTWTCSVTPYQISSGLKQLLWQPTCLHPATTLNLFTAFKFYLLPHDAIATLSW